MVLVEFCLIKLQPASDRYEYAIATAAWDRVRSMNEGQRMAGVALSPWLARSPGNGRFSIAASVNLILIISML